MVTALPLNRIPSYSSNSSESLTALTLSFTTQKTGINVLTPYIVVEVK